MIAYSFKEVRPALIAASMKWMKWIGRSPVERAAAALPNLRRRCAWRTTNRRPTLRRDRAVELNGLTKKFQRLSVVSNLRLPDTDSVHRRGHRGPDTGFELDPM